MKIEVVDCQDHDDGSVTVSFDLDDEAIRHFASIGLLKIIKESAENVLDTVDE